MERALDDGADNELMLRASVGKSVAGLRHSMNDTQAGEERMRWVIDAVERAGQGDSLDAVAAHVFLANMLTARRANDDADAEVARAEQILAHCEGDRNADLTRLALDAVRGRIAFQRGTMQSAIEILEPTLAGLRESISVEEFLFRETAWYLAMAFIEQKRFEDAAVLAAELVEQIGRAHV